MKCFLRHVLLLLCVKSAVAQNLIPDFSFEDNTFVPMDFSALHASKSWSAPSHGTTDLYCKCDRKTKLLREKIYSDVDVPQNMMGFQHAHSGTCYAGLFLFSHGDYREYLQTPLKVSLEKNKAYLFSMYISLADYSRTSIDQLGFCFLKTKVDFPFSDVITDLDPLYINIDKEIETDTEDWHLVTATYIASGGESYLLFGSFEINKITKTKLEVPKEIKTRINQAIERDAYYFIDDVSLVEIYTEEPPDMVLETNQEPMDTIPTDSLFILKNVLFQTNETTLLPSSYLELELLVEHLKKEPQSLVEIMGHTDNSGSEKVNQTLSEGRAKAVSDYLVSKGIKKTRITYTGFGSSRPISTNTTDEGRQQNRRVEFIIRTK